MRFLSCHRRFERTTRESRRWGEYSHLKHRMLREASCRLHRWLGLLTFVCLCFSGELGFGQPPGTTPSRQVFSQQDGVDASGLPIRAFMFLSESDNVVLMPGLSWEEFERLSNPDSAVDSNQ